MGVVEDQRAFGAGDLDPGGAVVRIARRQVPAAADGHQHAVVHGDDRPHDVVGAVERLHIAVGALRIDAHRLGGLEQPEHEIEIVGGFHHHRRQLHALGDLGAEPAVDVAADHHRHHLAERAVGDLLLGEGELGVEALRIADRELEAAAPRQRDQLVRLPQLDRDRLFEQHMLAGFQAVAGDRIVVLLRRGADIDHRDVRVAHDVLVVERRGRGPGERLDLGQAVRADLADVQLVHQRRARQRLGADAAAPAGADHRGFDLLHRRFPKWASICLFGLPARGPQ